MMYTGKLMMIILLLGMAARPASGQVTVAAVIQAGVKKVICALDLRIQRQQIKALEMQTLQKKAETSMVTAKLAAISEWINKQRRLYEGYYKELWQVKSILRTGGAVRDIMTQETLLLKAYQDSWQRLQGSGQFSAKELDYLAGLYGEILKDNNRHMAALHLVIQDFLFQMPDAMRLESIRHIDRLIAADVDDLLRLNRENWILALQRSRTKNNIRVLGDLYGSPVLNAKPSNR